MRVGGVGPRVAQSMNLTQSERSETTAWCYRRTPERASPMLCLGGVVSITQDQFLNSGG